jgi:hypothetical protein
MAKVQFKVDPKFAATVAKDKGAIEKASKVKPRKEFDGPDGVYFGSLGGVECGPDRSGKNRVGFRWVLTDRNEGYVGVPLFTNFQLTAQKDGKGVVFRTVQESYEQLFSALKLLGVPEKLLTEKTLVKALQSLDENLVARLNVKTGKKGYKNVYVNGVLEEGGGEEETAYDEETTEETSEEETTDETEESTDDESSDDGDESTDESSDEPDEGSDENEDESEEEASDEPVIPTVGDKFLFKVKGKKNAAVHTVKSVNRAKNFCSLQGPFGLQKDVKFEALGDMVEE